ncbi:nucleotide excision repair, TFIIH, subunit [Cystobasidium minutum MCA 4210]|uniref:nucleotide excision repair, TFIIH, subunit n=1 Tax=Cystobasidium minutum MCA 4210 TaxID=1397322 RepID=UPI0034D00E6C|eukprot:jgi/Rhomi1/197440/gm1.5654_g
MVRAIKGVLITTDPPVKQLILSMNEEQNFLIQDLDETHLLVSADSVEMIKEQLEEELEKNTFTVEF